jgi:stage II sporulation protein D
LITILLLAGCDRRVVPTDDGGDTSSGGHVAVDPSIPGDEPMVRVRLHRVTREGHTIQIGRSGQTMLLSGGGTEMQLGGPAEVSRGPAGWTLAGVDLPAVLAQAGSIELHSTSPLSVGSGSERVYEGIIRCVADHDSSRLDYDVVNVIEMEQYIPGVLAGELFEGWHDAAFKAQAVAARSYAVSQCQQRRSRTWDVTDTASSQMYIGVPSWDQATRTAAATRGEIITWKGAVVPGYFCSCCGGRAARAVDAVGPNPINNVPPLGGHQNPAWCTEAPRYRWTGPWDVSRVSHAIRSWGRRVGRKDCEAIGRVISIRAVSPNRHGRPTKVEITGSGGRSATIRCVDLPGVFHESDLKPLSSGWVDADVKRGLLVVDGHGFGHGVGLCQYGAEAMAASALPYDRIIRFYYPRAELTKAW